MARRVAAAAAAAALDSEAVLCEDDTPSSAMAMLASRDSKHEPPAAGAGAGAGAFSAAGLSFAHAHAHAAAAATVAPLSAIIKPLSDKDVRLQRREESRRMAAEIREKNWIMATSLKVNPVEIPLAGYVGEFVPANCQEAAQFHQAELAGRKTHAGSALLWAPGVTLLRPTLRRLHVGTPLPKQPNWRYAVNALVSNGRGKVLQLIFVGTDPTFAAPRKAKPAYVDPRERGSEEDKEARKEEQQRAQERGFAAIEAMAVAGIQLPMIRPVSADVRIEGVIMRFNTLTRWNNDSATRKDDGAVFGAWPAAVIATAIPQPQTAPGQPIRSGVQEPYYVPYAECNREWGADALSDKICGATDARLAKVVEAAARRLSWHVVGVADGEQKARANELCDATWKATFRQIVLLSAMAVISSPRNGQCAQQAGEMVRTRMRELVSLMLCEPTFTVDGCSEMKIAQDLRRDAALEPTSGKPNTGVFLAHGSEIAKKLHLEAARAVQRARAVKRPSDDALSADTTAAAAAKAATAALEYSTHGRRCLLAPCVDSGVAVPFFVDSDAISSDLSESLRLADDMASQAVVEVLSNPVTGLAFPLATLKANVDTRVSRSASPAYYAHLSACWREWCDYHAAARDARAKGAAEPQPPNVLIAKAVALYIHFQHTLRVNCERAARERQGGANFKLSKPVTVIPASVMQFVAAPTPEQLAMARADMAAAKRPDPGRQPSASVADSRARFAAPRPTFDDDGKGLFGSVVPQGASAAAAAGSGAVVPALNYPAGHRSRSLPAPHTQSILVGAAGPVATATGPSPLAPMWNMGAPAAPPPAAPAARNPRAMPAASAVAAAAAAAAAPSGMSD